MAKTKIKKFLNIVTLSVNDNDDDNNNNDVVIVVVVVVLYEVLICWYGAKKY